MEPSSERRCAPVSLVPLLVTFVVLWLLPASARAQWTDLAGAPNASSCLLLTDGTVICQEGEEAHTWRRLTPDQFGSYANGTWSSIATFPSTYGPLYYASAVLADGRALVIGGEYNSGVPNCPSNPGCFVNAGYIYDPVANTWTALTPPETQIGDADSVVLTDGRFVLRHLFSKRLWQYDNGIGFALLNNDGSKFDNNGEEGSVLLPDGRVLVVDAGVQGGTNSEIYDPVANTWSSAGSTVVSLPDNGGMNIVPELGPQVLRPDGTVIAFGASSHNAIYNIATGLWGSTQDFPMISGDQMVMADAPATLLPNGNVLAIVSQFFSGPYHALEFDLTSNTFLSVVDPSNNGPSSFRVRTLLLPTGQVLVTDGSSNVHLYTPSGTFASAWRPVITSAPSNVVAGGTYVISGQQFNGMSQASMYGDDAQMATNYPLVRITNDGTGHVCYARTHNHSSMGVATGSAIVSTTFEGPLCLESGPSHLVVVANGIPSAPIVVNGPDLTITKAHAPAVFTQGDTGNTFTITVTNDGAQTTSGLVTVTDTLPASLTATAISGPGWACALGTLSCTRADALASGNSYPTITVTVDVSSGAPILVTNHASVSGGGEADNVTTNNTAADDVNVRQHTTTTVLSATDDYDDVVTLQAYVAPTGVSGSVQFFVNGSPVGTATYDTASGHATRAYLIPLPAGTYDIQADFSSSNALYLDSSDTLVDGLTVTREETTLSYTGDTVIANGGTATLSALLLEDGATPIAGRTVNFTLGTGGGAQTCSDTTDLSGTASCSVSPVAQPLGPGSVSAEFAGDTFYLPASDSKTTVVFAFLSSGADVIGDGNAGVGTHVTFWGDGWNPDNSLSGGAAPNSFKGFASTTAEPPACGSLWSTRNGNSAGAPSTVPEYMGVAVATHVNKSGATTSGDIRSIVVVRTDPGYGLGPGHEGTGVVVATFCHP
jgi:uncharacterized repeat protein (TIGR01451 family)